MQNETGPGILSREKRLSAICVQRFDDSLNPAIHITYRVSRRSSSLREPSDPSLKDIFLGILKKYKMNNRMSTLIKKYPSVSQCAVEGMSEG